MGTGLYKLWPELSLPLVCVTNTLPLVQCTAHRLSHPLSPFFFFLRIKYARFAPVGTSRRYTVKSKVVSESSSHCPCMPGVFSQITVSTVMSHISHRSVGFGTGPGTEMTKTAEPGMRIYTYQCIYLLGILIIWCGRYQSDSIRKYCTSRIMYFYSVCQK